MLNHDHPEAAPDRVGSPRAELLASAFCDLGRHLSAARTAGEAAAIIAKTADLLFCWDACVLDACESLDHFETIFCQDTINGRRVDCIDDVKGNREPGKLGLLAVTEGPQLELRQPGECRENSFPFGSGMPSASIMVVPVRKNDRVLAVLSVQSYRQNAYRKEDLSVLLALADHCAGAMERIRAEQELHRLNQELERRVRERTAQLEAINKELEAFSYSVSHDLRAPLRSIRGFTEVLTERYQAQLDGAGRQFLSRVSESARQMDRLIEDLLKLSRVGRAAMQLQEVDLSLMAQAIVHDLQQSEPERKVSWALEPDLTTVGDPRLLRVALENLLRNAWKFSARKSQARIEFGMVTQPEKAFFVRDNGAGFDMIYSSKLFGVFQRLHSAGEFPGTGVGLATVQRIINRHQGRVWAEAAVGDGATFYFTLPNHQEGQ